MKLRSLIVAAILVSFACKQEQHAGHDNAGSTGTSATSATTATTAAATAPYDLQFLDTMSHHHQMGVDMVKAAEGKFAHKELADAARKMVADQQKEIAQMKAWRDQWYSGAAPAPNMNMPGMASPMNMDTSHMTSMSGHALDMMFIDMMIPHHEGAVAMANDALANAEHAEIKELARKIVDAQTREIEQFRKWKQTWAGSK